MKKYTQKQEAQRKEYVVEMIKYRKQKAARQMVQPPPNLQQCQPIVRFPSLELVYRLSLEENRMLRVQNFILQTELKKVYDELQVLKRPVK